MDSHDLARYTNDLDARIDRCSDDLERLKARAPDASADDRMAFERRMGELEEKRQGARARVDALRASGDMAGDELQNGARAAVDDLDAAVARARRDLG